MFRLKTLPLIAWLLGFLLLANVYLTPFLSGLRATDVLGAALGLWLLWRLATTGVRAKPFITLVVLGVVPLLWGLLVFFGEASTVVMSMRWLLAAPWAYALVAIVRDSEQRTSLAWGLWWGCVVNVIVLFIQFLGFVELTQNIGLATQQALLPVLYDLGSSGTERVPGMQGHPNGSAAVVSLVIPLGLYLYYAGKARAWVVIASLCVLFAGTQFTYTRSALLVSFVTLAVVFVVSSTSKRTLRLATLFLFIGLPTLALLGPPGGWERWLNPSNVEANSSIRLLSNVESLRISLRHPFGLGVEGSQEALGSLGFYATHNAFLHIATIYGLLFAGVVMLLMLVAALHIFAGLQNERGLEAMIAVQTFGLFFWEEHFNNAAFIILASWLVAASVSSLSFAAVRWRSAAEAQRPAAGRHAFPQSSRPSAARSQSKS